MQSQYLYWDIMPFLQHFVIKCFAMQQWILIYADRILEKVLYFDMKPSMWICSVSVQSANRLLLSKLIPCIHYGSHVEFDKNWHHEYKSKNYCSFEPQRPTPWSTILNLVTLCLIFCYDLLCLALPMALYYQMIHILIMIFFIVRYCYM